MIFMKDTRNWNSWKRQEGFVLDLEDDGYPFRSSFSRYGQRSGRPTATRQPFRSTRRSYGVEEAV